MSIAGDVAFEFFLIYKRALKPNLHCNESERENVCMMSDAADCNHTTWKYNSGFTLSETASDTVNDE